MKIWIEDGPIYEDLEKQPEETEKAFKARKSEQEEKIIKFVEERMTCSMPNRLSSPILHDLVSQFQVHKCTKSCRRYRPSKSVTVCRFGYPQSPSSCTRIRSMEESVRSRFQGINSKNIS